MIRSLLIVRGYYFAVEDNISIIQYILTIQYRYNAIKTTTRGIASGEIDVLVDSARLLHSDYEAHNARNFLQLRDNSVLGTITIYLIGVLT